MRISVIGCGYLGAVHAATLASMGHSVVGIDVDAAKVEQLGRGAAPFFEPGLDELLRDGIATGRLRFSTDFADAAGAQLHFLCVGTPQSKTSDGADLSYLVAATEALLPHLAARSAVVGKSTVPVGTVDMLSGVLSRRPDVLLGWNPEFLRQGTAVRDSLVPDRLVYGVPETASRRTALARRCDNRPRQPALPRRRGGHRRPRCRLRAPARRRDSAPGLQLRHGGTDQVGVERVPGHEAQFHQRHGRALRRHGRRRETAGRGHGL